MSGLTGARGPAGGEMCAGEPFFLARRMNLPGSINPD
jgi:hypothetical protein